METGILTFCKDLKKYYPIRKGLFARTVAYVKAVDGVELKIRKGETLGLVGESGCGKTTLGRLFPCLEDPTSGELYMEGRSIIGVPQKELRTIRRDIQIIFQDPYSSLNPRKKVKTIIGEAFMVHHLGNKRDLQERVIQLLTEVGLREEHIDRFPHEFSGGQRQRIGIARALILNPKFVICDEPVSALDVSIQAQVLNLLRDLQKKYQLTYLFISHDLSVVEHVSDRIAVMYLGKIVELGNKQTICGSPQHPYTEALLSATPIADPFLERKKVVLTGDLPNPINPPEGCSFNTRCSKTMDICRKEIPELKEVSADHLVRCFLHQ